MGKGAGRGTGKDPELLAEEREDRLLNAEDTLDDAKENYKQAQDKLKLDETTYSETEKKLTRTLLHTKPVTSFEQKWQDDLNKATEALAHERTAAKHALHAQNRAERGLKAERARMNQRKTLEVCGTTPTCKDLGKA